VDADDLAYVTAADLLSLLLLLLLVRYAVLHEASQMLDMALNQHERSYPILHVLMLLLLLLLLLLLRQVRYVVLDEADQMLDMGFEEDMEVILQQVRQAGSLEARHRSCHTV
jgi:hypothetical protein